MDERDKTSSDRAFLCTGIMAARASLELQNGRGSKEARAALFIYFCVLFFSCIFCCIDPLCSSLPKYYEVRIILHIIENYTVC